MPCLVNSTSTTSKRSIWPETTRDLWVVEAYGSVLKLSNGKIYDDWCSALGANTLGFDTYVNAFSSYDARFQPASSLPWQIEHDFAEEFCAAMGTEGVRFFKSGSDALSCAVRLARDYRMKQASFPSGTPGRIIVFDQSYHGTGDWFGPALWTHGGIVSGYDQLIKLPFGEPVTYNALHKVACIVVESVPKAIDVPPAGWLEGLRRVCDEYGIILISDEVILGYRHSLRGYCDSAGVRVDLACYGKAMGQGAAISACTGRADIMGGLADRVHFSGTNNGEPLPLQIAQWTLREYQEKKVCEILTAKGEDLKFRLTHNDFKTKGLLTRFEILFDSPKEKMDCTRFCFEHGILFPGFCSLAVSHTAPQCERLVDTLKKWRDK